MDTVRTNSAPDVLRRILRAILRYVAILLSYVLVIIVFRIGNRVKERGKRIPITEGPLLVVTPHQTMKDSFLLGYEMFFPQLLWRPQMLPWHLADKNNFEKHPLLGWIFQLLHAIPVDRTKRSTGAFIAGCKVLRHEGILCVFPEGGRERPGEGMRSFVKGALSYAIAEETPILIAAFDGMFDVEPYQTSPLDDPNLLRRFLRHTAWLTQFRIGQRVTFTWGPLLTVENVRRISGEGTKAERRERLTRYVEGTLRSLMEDTRCARHDH